MARRGRQPKLSGLLLDKIKEVPPTSPDFFKFVKFIIGAQKEENTKLKLEQKKQKASKKSRYTSTSGMTGVNPGLVKLLNNQEK